MIDHPVKEVFNSVLLSNVCLKCASLATFLFNLPNNLICLNVVSSVVDRNDSAFPGKFDSNGTPNSTGAVMS